MQRFFKATPLAIILVLAASCWHDQDFTYEPDAAITSFRLGNYKVWYNDINIFGRDTLVYRLESGAYVPFVIDQSRNLIFNPDSMPYGTDLKHLIVHVSGEGALYYQKFHSDGQSVDTVYSASDSIDFSRPLIFTVVSTDETYIRKYKVSVNAHALDPDSMKWKNIPTENYPNLASSKAFVWNDALYVFSYDGKGGIAMTTCRKDGTLWNTQASTDGITGNADLESMILTGNRLYVTDGGRMLSSTDGISWSDLGADTEIERIIPFTGSVHDEGVAWAISKDGRIVSSTDMVTWNTLQTLPEGFPTTDLAGISEPLASNPGIIRRTIIGTNENSSENSAVVFSMLSTDTEFTEMVPSGKDKLPCPRLQNLKVINYDGDFYAFGKGLKAFWQSSDHGLTWRDCSVMTDEYSSWNYKMHMPAGLSGYEGSFASTTDANGYIWIITESQGIWRGGINRLVR